MLVFSFCYSFDDCHTRAMHLSPVSQPSHHLPLRWQPDALVSFEYEGIYLA